MGGVSFQSGDDSFGQSNIENRECIDGTIYTYFIAGLAWNFEDFGALMGAIPGVGSCSVAPTYQRGSLGFLRERRTVFMYIIFLHSYVVVVVVVVVCLFVLMFDLGFFLFYYYYCLYV